MPTARRTVDDCPPLRELLLSLEHPGRGFDVTLRLGHPKGKPPPVPKTPQDNDPGAWADYHDAFAAVKARQGRTVQIQVTGVEVLERRRHDGEVLRIRVTGVTTMGLSSGWAQQTRLTGMYDYQLGSGRFRITWRAALRDSPDTKPQSS